MPAIDNRAMRRRHAAAAALVWCAPAWSAQRGAHGSGVRSKAYGRRGDVLRLRRSIAVEHALDTGWVEATPGAGALRARRGATHHAGHPPAARRTGPPTARASSKRAASTPARASGATTTRGLTSPKSVSACPPRSSSASSASRRYYGRVSGSFRVLDALATLAFDFPTGRSDRSAFFRSELGHFCCSCQREGWDAVAVLGSLRRRDGPAAVHARAADQPMRSTSTGTATSTSPPARADVIGSVAHYLAALGWQRGMPTHYAVEPPADITERALLLVPDIVPSFNPAQMVERGARLDAAALQHERLAGAGRAAERRRGARATWPARRTSMH